MSHMVTSTLQLGRKLMTRTGRISPTKMKRAIKAVYPKSRITQTKEDDGTLRFYVYLL